MASKFNLKDQLAGIAALIAAIVAIGGGFVKYGEITTKLDALSEQTAPDLTPLAAEIGNAKNGVSSNQTNIAVLEKEIELLKIQMEELKISTTNPLSNYTIILGLGIGLSTSLGSPKTLKLKDLRSPFVLKG